MAIPVEQFRHTYHDHVRHDVILHVPKTGGQLLDLGGGIGATAAAIREMGLVDQIGVVDLVSPESSSVTLDFSYRGNLEDPALIERIQRERGEFQMILALDVLEHLVDPWAMARRLQESLARDGVLIVSLPNIRNFRVLFPLLFRDRWTYVNAGILDRTHLRFFVRETAVDLVRQAGLQIEKVVASPCTGRAVTLFRRLSLGLFNSFSDRQYIVIGRKAR